MDNFKKYLPSRKFITIVLFIIVLIVLFFSIRGLISLIKNRKVANSDNKVVQMTVGAIIQKDGNNNGIADWEEYLWGLDPNKNGPENKEFILAKKKSLIQSGDILATDDSKIITENEMLSQEFFATIISLQQTGELNEESINSLSDAIGQKIEATPLVDAYSSGDLKIKNDGTAVNEAYFNAFNALVTKYEDKDIGSELTLISQGLGNNDPQALYSAKTIAEAYKSFGSELINIPTPKSISSIHLSLANNYNKTAESIEGLTQILTDPIIGMRAILSYKKHSDNLVSDIEKLTEILQ
jgi:hypothetical protein